MLEVDDPSGRTAFAAELASARHRATTRGIESATDQRGLASAIVDGFLLLGARGGRPTIDVADGRRGDRSPTTRPPRSLDELPTTRVA